MLSKVKCVTFRGLHVSEVDVEVSVTRGIPAFEIVGLPNKSIEESRHRIKSAFLNCGIEFADSRITVNLAPAEVLKAGSIYDLAIAVGIFAAKNKLQISSTQYFLGELSLDGAIRNTRGIYLALDFINTLGHDATVPVDAQVFSRDFSCARIQYAANLKEVFNNLKGKPIVPKLPPDSPEVKNIFQHKYDVVITDIIGQNLAKRALEISAAGGHNLLLVGSPGTGKSMLAKSILSILTPLESSEIKELNLIQSCMGKGINYQKNRPFRSPHHTISYSGMIGGGTDVLPGEITLAHNGVLFMDEFCEFSRNVLEALRQPMQEGSITLSRNNTTYVFPSFFCLLAASNPCPCGYLGHATKSCVCSESSIANYAKKLSGPLADRFDLFVSLYPEEKFMSKIGGDKSAELQEWATVKERVATARNFQLSRLNKPNALMTNTEVMSVVHLAPDSKELLSAMYKKLNLSPRAYFKVLRVARTIADLAGHSEVVYGHIAEALTYRRI